MPSVQLGNPLPIFNGVATSDPDAVTVVHIPDSKSLADAVRDVAHVDPSGNNGLWGSHSGAPAPAWVESSSPELAAALAARFGCPIGRPAAVDPAESHAPPAQ